MRYSDNAKSVKRGLIKKDVDARLEFVAGTLLRASEICQYACANGTLFSKTSRDKYRDLIRNCYALLTSLDECEEIQNETEWHDVMPQPSSVNSQLHSRISLATFPTWEEDTEVVPVMGDDVAMVAELLTDEWYSPEEITVRDLEAPNAVPKTLTRPPPQVVS